MKIAIVGAGGREHALAWRFVREGHEVVGLPGNPGLAELGPCVEGDVVEVCRRVRPALVVVGPEAPLAEGLADRLREAGFVTSGPSREATRIESSKAFAKRLMAEAGIATPAFEVVETGAALEAAIARLGGRVVVKEDGLAAGKGVTVCDDAAEARRAGLGAIAKGPVVVERRLEGREVSVLAITDGTRLCVLPPTRDYKRLFDGDRGPNTGGLGATCPVEPGLAPVVRDTILRPVLAALRARGTPFTGTIYAGLMLTAEGPQVLEFNARFGDPETQAIVLALADDAPLGEWLFQAAMGSGVDRIVEADRAASVVVLAAQGYPGTPQRGDLIHGLDEARALGAEVFHAGTARTAAGLVTAGGRVLAIGRRGGSAQEAAARVRFAGVHRRTDLP